MAVQPVATSLRPLKFSEKLRAAAACAVSIWLFYTVGGMVIQPGDPLAAMSLVAHQHPLGAAISAALLTGVVSMLAAVIGPARLQGFACLAVGVGWVVLNWRSGTMEYMLLYEGGTEAATRSAMFGRLAVEALFWGALAVESLWIEAAIRGWMGARKEGDTGGEEGTGRGRRGVLAGMITVVVAAVFISQVAARSPVADVYKGQIYFAVGVGFFLGALVGLYFCCRVPLLYFLAGVCLTALLSYGWAMIDPLPELKLEAYRGLLDVVPTVLARPLPIEYVGLGMIGVVMASWSARRVYIPTAPGQQDD